MVFVMPTFTSIIIWIVLGAVAGWIASMITGKNEEMGLGANLLFGIVGAFVGGWLASLFGLAPATGFNLWSIIVAVVGAVILLGIVSLFKGRE